MTNRINQSKLEPNCWVITKPRYSPKLQQRKMYQNERNNLKTKKL